MFKKKMGLVKKIVLGFLKVYEICLFLSFDLSANDESELINILIKLSKSKVWLWVQITEILTLKINLFLEQWEKELEAELKEYEVVVDKAGDDKQWEKECEDLLGDDMDLK